MTNVSLSNIKLHQKNKVKPFIKWAGGKSQLLEQFKNKYPYELKCGIIKNYYEPFLGGGAVFFDIVQKYNIKNFYLSDINEELILVYKVIQKNVEMLIDFLDLYKKKYLTLNSNEKSNYFYEIRNSYNQNRIYINHKEFSKNWIPRAAQMIFLNKTCFNGLFRLNQKGEFNVPFGKYKNPQFFNIENLVNISKILQNIELKVADFGKLKNTVENSSFIYFDPPYKPISKTSSFTAYSKTNFDDNEQIRLSYIFKDLNKNGNRLMLSNSDPKNINHDDDFFERYYSEFNIQKILANRMINSNGNKRGKIKELLITNY